MLIRYGEAPPILPMAECETTPGGGPSVRRLMVGARVRGVRVGGWHALNVLRLTVTRAELTVTSPPPPPLRRRAGE